ncbi:SART-1 protein [Delphinella strobiligena]|nr:SART-1 protein [Delphinella strobiligena]
MDAIAIQDANKIRVAMGLAPLPVPGEDAGLAFKSNDDGNESDENDHISTLEKRQAAAGDNWARLEEERRVKEERIKRKEAAKKARDNAQRFAILEGKGLGDADGEEMDTKTWLMQQKKRQKKIDKARKYEEEHAERERAAQAEYTAKDLAGVKVGHTMDDLGDADEQILTLKDAEIGDEDEDDELENVDLRAKERLEEKLELQKKKPVYNPNDVDESGKKSILAHYDEEIEGKKNKGAFTLDGQGSLAKREIELADADADRSKGIKISLDILKDDTPVNDYQDPSTIKMRKPKKAKKPKTSRQKAADEDDIFPTDTTSTPSGLPEDGAMDVDGGQGIVTTTKKRTFEFDDDDLQAKLAEQRRQALKKRKKTDAAELARQLREEQNDPEDDDQEEPGMVIDETTEFVSNLKRAVSSDEEDRPRRGTATPAHRATSADPDAEDTDMQEAYGELESRDQTPALATESTTAAPVQTSTGFEAEEEVSQGIGASLKMLRKRGLVEETDASAQNARDRARAIFLAENRAIIADYDEKSKTDREAIRASGRWTKMSRADQETYNRQANERREQFLAQLQAEHYRKSYKPDVKLRYNDEFGREMNAKEAFKHLSHQFHGKGSGKQKTEKRLKKIEDERKRDAVSSLDSSQHTGMNNAMGAQARKNRQAGVRLQ